MKCFKDYRCITHATPITTMEFTCNSAKHFLSRLDICASLSECGGCTGDLAVVIASFPFSHMNFLFVDKIYPDVNFQSRVSNFNLLYIISLIA